MTSSSALAAPRWCRVLLAVVALLELMDAVLAFPVLFGDLSEIPGPGLGGWTITATIALRPVAALAAFVLAVAGRDRAAILALAVIVLLNWLSLLPSVILHGLEFRGYAALSSLGFIVDPTLALAAAWLARTGSRFTVAALLVSAPTVARLLGLVAFAIGVMIYGF